MSGVLTQHLICVQVGLLTAAIIMIALQQGKHPIFLGLPIVHFKTDAFLFSHYAFEMLSHRPAINNLKAIRTDIEKAIFNGFLSQIKDLKLLLCVFHLQQNDKRRLTELKPKP